MSTTTLHFNSPQRDCRNCAYRIRNGDGWSHPYCARTMCSCTAMRQTAHNQDYVAHRICDENFSGWQPKPPRRSLRRWLYDIFLA